MFLDRLIKNSTINKKIKIYKRATKKKWNCLVRNFQKKVKKNKSLFIKFFGSKKAWQKTVRKFFKLSSKKSSKKKHFGKNFFSLQTLIKPLTNVGKLPSFNFLKNNNKKKPRKKIGLKSKKSKQKSKKTKKVFPLFAQLKFKTKAAKIKQITVFSPSINFWHQLFYWPRKILNLFNWNTNKIERKIFYSVLLAYGILGSFWQIYDLVFLKLPSPLDLTRKDQIVSTRILDRNGKLLYQIYEDENRTLVSLNKIPPHVIQATIAIEDKNFYHHHGFSIQGIVRAFFSNATSDDSLQGGSTITQQLVKNRLLTSERTLKRKIRELLLAILVEGTYSKDEILEMYLNQVPYGGATYGIEEAAWRYFNKSASDLTLAEGALLAGLPQSPSQYSPFGANPELAYLRQEEVLRRMVEDGYISAEQKQAAMSQSLNFRMDTIDIRAPHFVMYVKKILAEQFGEAELNTGGLEVRTTLDLSLQDASQEIVSSQVNALKGLRVNNGAALVTNPKTGEILAMVGSKDYFDFEHDGQVNVALRPRQPGSSIKPLTYAIAFEQGQSPSTMIEDAPVSYQIAGSPVYSPQNYDGKYHGKVSIRQALASSYNIPAVKTLASVGVDTMLDKAEDIGFSTWQDRKRFGLSLTLGGGEVLMTEMAELYGTFANLGETIDLNPILEVKNYKGELLYRNECVFENDCFKVNNFSAKTAYQITDILADNEARTPAFGPRSVLYIPNQEVAVKTGTTNSLRDNWTIGYTTDRLVAVWVGNNDNTPMSYVASGVTGASPIWNGIMRSLLDQDDPHKFVLPEGLIKVKVCAETGTLPCLGCPTVVEELYAEGDEPRKACNPAFFTGYSKFNTQSNRNKILQGQQIQRFQ